MADFHFDNTKSFHENVEAFLQYMEADDADLGALLRANANKLAGATDDTKRKAARTAFNAAINTALIEKLAKKGESE